MDRSVFCPFDHLGKVCVQIHTYQVLHPLITPLSNASNNALVSTKEPLAQLTNTAPF